MKADPCRICSGLDISVVVSYKHLWFFCAECGNVTRINRDRYFWEFVPRSLIARLPRGRKLAQHLLHFKSGADFYDYYLDDAQGEHLERERTKWASETRDTLDELARAGIDVRGKRLLDISGGPGFLVRDLQDFCATAVVTEFHPAAVRRMQTLLGVRAAKYDYNTDDLGDILPERFDIVLIRYSINFCNDLKALARSVRAILANGGVIYVSFVPPTLGTCFRWQFDEYTYPNLYQPETVARCFAEAGFGVSLRYEFSRYPFLRGMHPGFKILTWPYVARNLFVNCDRRLVQRNYVMVLSPLERSETTRTRRAANTLLHE